MNETELNQAPPHSAVMEVLAALPGVEYKPYNQPTDKPGEVSVVLYHANCVDGFGAAWAAHRFYKYRYENGSLDILYIPVGYGKTDEVVTTILTHFHGYKFWLTIVDFSLPPHQFEELVAHAIGVVYLDHHKGAQDTLHEASEMCIRAGVESAVVFCNDRSGVIAAWDYYFPEEEAPLFLKRIQDHDLWQFNYPDTKAIVAALYSYPMTMDTWDKLSTESDMLNQEGQAIIRARDQHIESLTENWNVKRTTYKGHKVALLTCPYFYVSYAGNRLLEDDPDLDIAIMTWRSPTEMKFSLRSRKGGVDVSELAKEFGGGGHAVAAGINVPITDNRLPDNIVALLQALS